MAAFITKVFQIRRKRLKAILINVISREIIINKVIINMEVKLPDQATRKEIIEAYWVTHLAVRCAKEGCCKEEKNKDGLVSLAVFLTYGFSCLDIKNFCDGCNVDNTCIRYYMIEKVVEYMDANKKNISDFKDFFAHFFENNLQYVLQDEEAKARREINETLIKQINDLTSQIEGIINQNKLIEEIIPQGEEGIFLKESLKEEIIKLEQEIKIKNAELIKIKGEFKNKKLLYLETEDFLHACRKKNDYQYFLKKIEELENSLENNKKHLIIICDFWRGIIPKRESKLFFRSDLNNEEGSQLELIINNYMEDCREKKISCDEEVITL
jgi:hypothetical protein